MIPPASSDLPPDPGVAGEATIEGIDSNANGVRDDLELAIFAAYPNNPSAREILYNSAVAYQTMLRQNATASVVLDSFAYLVALSPCLETATGSPSVGDDMLRPNALNTYAGSLAYLTAMDTISSVPSLPLRTVTCTSLPSYPPLPPGTPSSITVPETSATLTHAISWGTALGAVERYELQRDTNNSFTAPITAYSGVALLGDSTVNQNGTYYYRVRACSNAGGCSNYRAGANGVVVGAPPGIPSSITVPASSTTGSYTVYWGAASGTVTRYELTETQIVVNCSINTGTCTSFPSKPYIVYTGTALQYPIISKGGGTYTYGYSVRACNDTACGDYRVGTTITVSVPTVLQPPRWRLF